MTCHSLLHPKNRETDYNYPIKLARYKITLYVMHIMLLFQMLKNVPKDNTTAVLMLCATIPKDRTTAHANLDILEMDGLAKVHVCQYHDVT